MRARSTHNRELVHVWDDVKVGMESEIKFSWSPPRVLTPSMLWVKRKECCGGQGVGEGWAWIGEFINPRGAHAHTRM